MFHPRIMTGGQCALDFQFVSFLYVCVKHHRYDALKQYSIFEDVHIKNCTIKIPRPNDTHFK